MKKIFYYVIPLLLFFSACQKEEKKDFIGPEYKVASSGFNLVSNFSVNLNEVNFATDQQFFKAQFNESVTWTIELKGLTSQAVKTITGLSDRVDESNSLWLGTHDDFMFFQSGEEVEATLSMLGVKDPQKVNFKITNARIYPGAKEMGSGFEGFVLNSKAWEFSPYFDKAEKAYGEKVTEPRLEGNYAFKLSGTDKDNSYHIGLLRWGASNLNIPANTKEFWFNIFVYGNGNPNGVLNIALKHDTYTKNANGRPDGYDDLTDDIYEYPISLNFKGWRLFSIKYSSFSRSTVKQYGGGGPNIKDPTKIVLIDYALQSKPTAGSKVEAIIDYPTITFDGPFVP